MKPINLPMVDSEADFSAIDPLDSRYYDTEIACYLSERARVAYQAYVEAALAHGLAEFGICSKEIAEQIEEACGKVSAEDVAEEEKTTKHDIKALVNVIKSHLNDEAKPYVHFGATSYDIVATALSLQLRAATTELVIPRLIELEKTLLNLTDKYADTVQIGRTHGQHAVPITFGFAMAEYVSRLGASIRSMQVLSGKLKGKFSGAVGAYNALSLFVDDPFKFEQTVLGSLNIEPADYSNQIVPAENYVRLLAEYGVSAGIMANLGHDMRHLQRSEIAEVRETFAEGQTGSSTMAHKRNPWNFENVISMNKQVIAQLVNANLNLPSEHQRDLTDSASARFYGVVLASVASMAKRLNDVMSKLEVDTENMQKNLHMSGGAIAAEPLYLLLEKYGHTTAHEVSRSLAHKAQESGKSLYEMLETFEELGQYFAKFTDAEKDIIRNPEEHYTGLAAAKARAIHDRWSSEFK
ncbi:MAG TPA: lyase family protein [Candidatus Saccharimonadia bacterium]|nr:lyase family protein [Candidatus Saccharimonadia bacterium]